MIGSVEKIPLVELQLYFFIFKPEFTYKLPKKNRYGHNFQNIASKTNQRGLIVYDPTLIQFGADILKFVAVLVFFYGS